MSYDEAPADDRFRWKCGDCKCPGLCNSTGDVEATLRHIDHQSS